MSWAQVSLVIRSLTRYSAVCIVYFRGEPTDNGLRYPSTET